MKLTPPVFFLASTIIYFSPYLLVYSDVIQNSLSVKLRADYSAQTGEVVFFALLSIFVGILLYPRANQDLTIRSPNIWESRALTLVVLLFGGYTALTPDLYSAEKQDVLETTNRGHLLFYSFCSLGVVYSFLNGSRNEIRNLFLCVAGLLLVLYIGHRSALAITVLSLAYVLFRNKPISKIPFWYFVTAVALLIFFAIYKSVYVAIKSGVFDQVVHRLEPGSLIASALVGMEQFLIFLHLDYVVSSGFELKCSNIWFIPISIVPFAGSVFDATKCTFTDQIHPVFFSEFSGGVGANIWAEFFAIGGYFGLPMLVFTVATFSLVLEVFIRRISSPILKSGFIIAIMHFTFYIQRKELFGAFISAKRVVIAALIIYFFALSMKVILNGNSRRHSSSAMAAYVSRES